MTTFVLILLLILVLTGGQGAARPARQSWGADLNDQAMNPLDRSNPIANDIRRGWHAD